MNDKRERDMAIQNEIQKALALIKRNDFEGAKKIYEKILEQDRNQSDVWRMLAQIHYNVEHDTDKAIEELNEALSINPGNMWALIMMGNIYSRDKEDFEKARKYYDIVLEKYPDNTIALNNVGASYMHNNDIAKARICFENALATDNTYANSYYGLALVAREEGNLSEAFNLCVTGLRRCKKRVEDPDIFRELTKLCFNLAGKLAKETDAKLTWQKIVDELQKVDETEIKIVPVPQQGIYARLKYAPQKGLPQHVIEYSPDYPFVDHLVVHELTHLRLMQQNTIRSNGKCYINSESTVEAFMKRYLSFMVKKYNDISSSKRASLCEHLHRGISLQLMNFGLDLFVEHFIYRDYIELHPHQLVSLLHTEEDNIKSAKAGESGMFPAEIAKANKIMNLCTSLHLKEMYGIDLTASYNPSRDEMYKAQELYDEFKAYLETYKHGDENEYVEYVLSFFNMEEFLEIENEDDLTSKKETLQDINTIDVAEELKKADVKAQKNEEFKELHKDGADANETIMMSMYMLGAMQYFDKVGPDKTRDIAMQIAVVGLKGISPQKKYSIKAIPDKEFGGYEFLAYYYVGFKRVFPETLPKLGLPFSAAYDLAEKMYNKEKD